jgi:outer membrane protein OmpA-like peptidoglycan-associated protein
MERRTRAVRLSLSALALAAALAGCSTLQGNPPAKYEVFFAPGSYELAPASRAIVDKAAAAIKSTRPKSILIGAGGAKGIALSDERFNTVRDILVADGVDDAKIVQSNLPVEKIKGDTLADLRVEIQLVND